MIVGLLAHVCKEQCECRVFFYGRGMLTAAQLSLKFAPKGIYFGFILKPCTTDGGNLRSSTLTAVNAF